MKREVEIGSQLFINKYDTPETVRRWVGQMAAAKLKIIRLFLFWDHIEPSEGEWDFTRFDACFDEAEKLGLRVVPTLMPVSPPGWMRITAGPQDVANLDDPAFWSRAMDYVARVAARYAQNPALHSWILWNEPSREITQNEHSMPRFREYLKELYGGDIERLNRLYYNRYESFAEVGELNLSASNSLSFKGYAESVDWANFSVHNLCEKLNDIKNEIRKADPDHPVHVNPHNTAQNVTSFGQSLWSEGETVDFMGCSAHPSWHSTRFTQNRLHQSVAYFADLMKSATNDPDGEFWVTELQGGTNIFSGVNYLCPTYGDISRWVWEGVGCGASKVVFWCFNTRSGGFEGAEWGLLGQDGEPSPRLAAATKAAGIIERNQTLFDGAKPVKPDIWLLYSEASLILAGVEGTGTDPKNPRNAQSAADAVCGAYLLCADLGLQVRLIDEKGVRQGKLPQNAVLIAPGSYALEDGTCEALERFVTRGGMLIADGLFALKDRYGNISDENRKSAERIFGTVLKDIEATAEDFEISSESSSFGGWFLKLIFKPENAKKIADFSDGRPAVLTNALGSGSALRIGTVFFQRYLTCPSSKRAEFFARRLPKSLFKGLRLENVSWSLQMKQLESGDDKIIVLINSASAAQANLRSDIDALLTSLDGDEKFKVRAGSSVSIPMQPGAVRVFQLRK